MTKANEWGDVATAVQGVALAYTNMLDVRSKTRDDSKKAIAAVRQYEEAVKARYVALMAQWTEADGMLNDKRSAAAVLRRYYHETTIPRRPGSRR